jgi:hypothetical protein
MRKKSLLLSRLLSITGSFLVILSSISLSLPDSIFRCVLALVAALIVSIVSSEKSLWISAFLGCWTLFIVLGIRQYSSGGPVIPGIQYILPNPLYIAFSILPSLLLIAAPMYYRISRSED